MSVQATEEVQFVINWRDDITTRHIVRYKGVDYDITRVDVFEGYKSDLTLYAKKKANYSDKILSRNILAFCLSIVLPSFKIICFTASPLN